MPNWCDNEVKITFSNEADYKSFLTQADVVNGVEHVTEDEYGLFDKFISTPPDLLTGEGWYEWRIANWGTKWNPHVRDFELIESEYKVVLSLDTAWAPPIDFFESFSKFYPTANIQMIYYEPGMNFCGKASIQNGNVVDRYINDISPDMQIDAGAVLDKDGNIDWDNSDICMWDLLADDEKFMKHYEKEIA